MMKRFLHVGCGHKRKNQTTREFNSSEWEEVRYDIDASVNPDLIGSITDMSLIEDGAMDAIFSSHNIEHLYPFEVPLALSEFSRVLKVEGYLILTCPDLQSVCQLIAEDKLLEPAYQAPAGGIAPLDILYGYRPALARGNLYMAHRCGFTRSVLHSTILKSGFKTAATLSRGYAPFFDLWAIGSRGLRSEDELREIAKLHFPI